MKIVTVDPQTGSLWHSLVEQHQSSVFHSPAWLRVLAQTYHLEMRAHVLLDDDGQPQAGLPLCRHVDTKGKRIVILPFSDYCDPLVECREEWDSLVNCLAADGCPVVMRCVHNSLPVDDDRFTVVNQAKWHGLDLRPDLESLWRQIPDAAKRAIHKAKHNGVIVQQAQRPEELREFFRLHLGIRKYKYRLLAQPYGFFENIWHEFVEQQRGVLLTALYQGEMIGSTLFLQWKDGLYYKFNASAADHLSFRPNDLLIWEGIQYGKARGCTHLDFGLSDWDQEGLIRFKRKFATEEKTIRFLRYDVPAAGTNEAAGGQNGQFHSLLPQLTELFTNAAVPDDVTEKAGEMLYRFFM